MLQLLEEARQRYPEAFRHLQRRPHGDVDVPPLDLGHVRPIDLADLGEPFDPTLVKGELTIGSLSMVRIVL